MVLPTVNSQEVKAVGQLDRTGRIGEVFIVDDDYDMREALSAIFCQEGYRTAAFADGRSFVRLARGQVPACVLLDLCMPGMSGLEVLKELDARNYPAPILMVSAQEDVLNVVQAMRHGAFDYLEKRLDAEAIVTRVVEAIESWKQLHERDGSPAPVSPSIRGYYELTRREREVLAQIAAASSNKETARNLGISPRTVEIHRGRIMHKLGAKNRRSHAHRHEQRNPAPGRRGAPERVVAGSRDRPFGKWKCARAASKRDEYSAYGRVSVRFSCPLRRRPLAARRDRDP
ncbi:MAG: response regulator [Xanthobacteraceae bacterium]